MTVHALPPVDLHEPPPPTSRVLTVGPNFQLSFPLSGQPRCALFPTDFSPQAEHAFPYAVSLAEENDAHLILLYVAPKPGTNEQGKLAIADVMQTLNDIVPSDAKRWCYPAPIVRYGDAADGILEAATELEADLIVLGVRDAAGHLGAATHLERATAHKVVVHARCPVLTVRG